MAITVPSAFNMKMKFAPAFDDTDDATIEFAIEEASGQVGDAWIKDQTLAIMYLAAELLSVQKTSAANDGQIVSSETFGRISVTYKTSDTTLSSNAADYQTMYGKRFADLYRKNFGGTILVV